MSAVQYEYSLSIVQYEYSMRTVGVQYDYSQYGNLLMHLALFLPEPSPEESGCLRQLFQRRIQQPQIRVDEHPSHQQYQEDAERDEEIVPRTDGVGVGRVEYDDGRTS
jgi:hypothetical protein